jgi:hypothetical protein
VQTTPDRFSSSGHSGLQIVCTVDEPTPLVSGVAGLV